MYVAIILKMELNKELNIELNNYCHKKAIMFYAVKSWLHVRVYTERTLSILGPYRAIYDISREM